jgi:hypothetical protein
LVYINQYHCEVALDTIVWIYPEGYVVVYNVAVLRPFKIAFFVTYFRAKSNKETDQGCYITSVAK